MSDPHTAKLHRRLAAESEYIVELRLKGTGEIIRQHGPMSHAEADLKAAAAPTYITNIYTVHVVPAPETKILVDCPNCTAKMVNVVSMDRKELLYRICDVCGYNGKTGKVEPKAERAVGRGLTWGT